MLKLQYLVKKKKIIPSSSHSYLAQEHIIQKIGQHYLNFLFQNQEVQQRSLNLLALVAMIQNWFNLLNTIQ